MILGALTLADFLIGSVAWIIAAVALWLHLSRRRRGGPEFGWLIGGLLFAATVQLFAQFASDRKWSGGLGLAAPILGMFGALVLLACVIKAMTVKSKSRNRVNTAGR